MGFYQNRVLPHHRIRHADGGDRRRAETVRRTCERYALEIGFGSGLNLPYYPPTVTKVIGVDPSAVSAKIGRERIKASPFPVEVVGLSAEKIPVGDASVESVVSTFTLCTIPNVASALLEVRRALGPTGRFYFVEHGRAEDPKVVRWQKRLNPMQRALSAAAT